MSQPDSTVVLAPPTLVTTQKQMHSLLARLQREPLVAVDTESNSLYAYFYRVCLIQVSIPNADYLLDPLAPGLDVSPLGDLFGNDSIEKVFHAAENDILMLQRDYGFSFLNCFDTMLTARILGWQQASLAAILSEHFGVQLQKSMQKTDWGRRPLARDQLAYARLDTHYLVPLRDLMLAELQARGRQEEAEEAFASLERIVWVEKPFDPEGFWRIDGVRDLAPRALAVLQGLYLFRDAEARRRDIPPFKVLADGALLSLSEAQPRDLAALATLGRLSVAQARRMGPDLLAIIERGRDAPPPAPPSRQNHNGNRPDGATVARFEALRAWRAAKARERDVDTDVIVSNEVLLNLARLFPRTPQELAGTGVLGDWKSRIYGTEILQVLSETECS